ADCPDRQRAGHEPQRRWTGALRSAAASCRIGAPRPVGRRPVGCLCSLKTEIRGKLSQLHFVHHRSEPNWRHRTDPGPRSAWSEEADDLMRVDYASNSLITCPPVWLSCLKRPAW